MMRSTMIGLGLLALVLAGTAGAQEAKATAFECEVPWYRRGVDCSKKTFSVRDGETLTITVTAVTLTEDEKEKDADPKDVPRFQIFNSNTKEVEETLDIKKGKSKGWTNDTGKECIVTLNANVEWKGTRKIKGNYTVAKVAPR